MKPTLDILRWNIRKRQTDLSVIEFPVGKFPLEFVDPKMRKAVKQQPGVGVVRKDTNELITIAGADYQLVEHGHIIAAVTSMFKANKIRHELYDVHTGGSKGNRMYANYILPAYSFKVGKDKFHPFVQVQNSYDKFILFGLVTGLYREACWNGNLWGTRDMQFLSKKHISENIALEDIAWNIDSWVKSLGVAEDAIKDMMKQPLSKTTYEEILKAVLPKPKDQGIFADFKLYDISVEEFGKNKYALFNALTAYATHAMAQEAVCKNYDKARQVQMAITKQFILA
jgi:hypothetical protein